MIQTLSKSDFQLARSCITKLHYRESGYPRKDEDNPYLAMLAEGGYMVEQLARLRYPEGVELDYGRDPITDWARTRERLEADAVVLFEATLLSGRALARVDILIKRGHHLDLIEVKSKSYKGDDLADGPAGPLRSKVRRGGAYPILAAWRPYLEDVTYQASILAELYPDAIVTPHLLIVDQSRTTAIDGLPGMFTVRRDVEVNGRRKDLDVRFTGDPGAAGAVEFLRVLDVSAEVAELMPEVVAARDEFLALYDANGVRRQPRPLDWSCGACEFRVEPEVAPNGFRECWGPLADPDPHLFDLYKLGSNKFGGERLGDILIRSGRTSLYDVDPAALVRNDGTPTKDSVRQLIQLHHTTAATVHADPALGPLLDGLGWPLHFIDFETSQLAVPYHRGMRPYEKVAFQWSCHTLAGWDAAPVHREWLNVEALWPNAAFVRSLREAVGDTGPILMWSPYERTVLRDIGDQLQRYGHDDPELQQWLHGVLGAEGSPSRLVDQNEICLRTFFHPRMRGRTSIKVVLDALWPDDPTMQAHLAGWMREPVVIPAGEGPYEALPPVEVAGTALNVANGTDAMRAYQAMLYGAERHDPATVATLQALLRRYCELDTLAMVLIWDHWRRLPRP